MRRLEALAAAAMMLFLFGCTQLPEETADASDAIWNGTPTDDFPAVGALTEDGAAFCTGTLVDEVTVLTAAHCVDFIDSVGGADIRFYTGPGAPGALEGGVPVVDALSHPDWDGLTADIGLAFLGEPCGETPQFVNVEDMMPFHWKGRDVTLVGYGITADDLDDSGLKLMTEVGIYAFDEDIFFHYTVGTNACFGDSGGPALYEFEEGWRVVGVISGVFDHVHADSSCIGGGGYHIRPDIYADWLHEQAEINVEPSDDDDDDDDTTDDDTVDDDVGGPLDDEAGGCQCRQGTVGARGFCALALLVALLRVRR